MSLAVERLAARAWSDAELDPLFEGAFPAFITADPVAKKYIGRIREWFGELNIIMVEDVQAPVATGWGVPLRWNGDLADLPVGYGGQIIATAPQSQTMTGTVQELEAWTRMALPATGDYVISGGLSTLHIDIDEDRGTYTEPNGQAPITVGHPGSGGQPPATE